MLFPLGEKGQGLEANGSPSSNAKVKYDETIPPFPHTSSWYDV
jgi:hypothetical protein